MEKKKMLATTLTRNLVLSSFFLSSLMAMSPAMAATNFWGGYSMQMQTSSQGVGVLGRSFFTNSVEAVPGGFKLTVNIINASAGNQVSLDLQVAINDGSGNFMPITIAHLSDAVADSPTELVYKREYLLTYDELNQSLEKLLPATAKQVKIEPGAALFVLGRWPQFEHTWGGVGRGGIFYTPKADGGSLAPSKNFAGNTRPQELDLAYPISMPMAVNYNIIDANGKAAGLAVNGQIRSRLEKEGKFQVPLGKADEIKKRLYALANNPYAAGIALGPDWKIEPQLRYMKKDANGNMLLDSNGLPIPDPMVDTYYDNANMDAAKNDVAIRYRWTEGNGTGAWNIKPGRGRVSKEGSVSRIEYGIDTTDDKPETVMKFANSSDPLNPFQSIRDVIPGAVPSEFLKPALKITDTRHKFKLRHKNGLIIEISLDDVHAESLRSSSQGRYVQLEMDIDHLSTASANVAKTVDAFNFINSDVGIRESQFLAALTDKAYVDGTPVIHNIGDLTPGSPVLKNHQADFDLAEGVIVALRQHTLGDRWLPAPQKASLAAFMLGMVRPQEAAGSVQSLIRQAKKFTEEGLPPGSLMQRLAPQRLRCEALFH